MITAKDCVTQIEKSDPKIKITSVKDYGSEFLLTYSYDGEETIPDPFILVGKNSGLTRRYTIAENPAKYYSTPDIPF